MQPDNGLTHGQIQFQLRRAAKEILFAIAENERGALNAGECREFLASIAKNLEDVADATSQEADVEGITGFMYGCAVSTLSRCWKHGEQLRRWHNINTQLGNEGEKANESGGVLNPALLSVVG